MGVLDKVLNNVFSLKYYGINDLSTRINIKTLLENVNSIVEYYSQIDYKIISIDELLDFLVLKTITKYEESKEFLVNKEDKNSLQQLINFSKNILSKYDDSLNQIYNLLNEQYQQLLSDNTDENINLYDLQELLMEYVYKQYDRINSEVFLYIEKEQWWYIISNFDICVNYYKYHISDLDFLLLNIFEQEKDHLYSNIVHFLMEHNKLKEFQCLFKKYAAILADKVLNLVKTINEDNYIEIIAFCENVIKVAKIYNLSRHLREFDKQKLIIEEAKIANSKKHGKLFKTKINIKEIIDRLKEELKINKYSHNIIFLQLTHYFSPSKNKFIASITKVFDNKKSIFDDVHHIGLITSDIFTASVQYNLRYLFKFYISIFSYIINDNAISELFFNNLFMVLENIFKKYNIDYEEVIIELDSIIDAIIYLYSIDETYPYYRIFCFGLSQTLCSYIEKILRLIFIEIYDKGDTYFPESQITLGRLLDSEIIKDILSENLSLILRYELHLVNKRDNGLEKYIGNNLRNKLMHNYDIDLNSEVGINLAVHLFHILILTIHQLEASIIKIIN